MSKKRSKRDDDWLDWGKPESQLQIAPSHYIDANGDPVEPPYRRYLPDPEKKRKKVRKK